MDIEEAKKNISETYNSQKCGNNECDYLKEDICRLGYISQPRLQCRDWKEPN